MIKKERRLCWKQLLISRVNRRRYQNPIKTSNFLSLVFSLQ